VKTGPGRVRPWCLVIGGASGTGKTTVAKTIAREQGITWVQADDLRLALQWSDVRLPSDAATDALYYFLRTPDVWREPAVRLRDALIAVGEVMTEAIAVVIGNHVAQHDPVVIEGDGILPSILEHVDVRPHTRSGSVRMVLLSPASQADLMERMLQRGRGMAEEGVTAEARRAAEAAWLYSQWLRREGERRAIPIVECRPWGTLATRIVTSAGDLPPPG
jgi:2-phosphoglycerate kinase